MRLWDATGKLRWGHAAALRPGACALSADGKRVAVIEERGEGPGSSYAPRVHAVSGGEGRWLTGPSNAIWLGLDGDALITVQRDLVQRWQDGKPTTLATLPAAARAADLSPDSKTIAWTDGSKVYLHAVGAEPVALPAAVEGEIKRLALLADGARVALAGDRKVTLWDVAGATATWTSKIELSVPHSPAVGFRPDGAVLASRVQKVVTLDTATGQMMAQPPVTRFLGWTTSGAARVLRDKEEHFVAIDTGERTPAADDGTPDWADDRVVAADGTITAWATDECAPLKVWRSGERTLPAPAGCDVERGGVQGWRVGPTRAIGVGQAATVYDLADGKVLTTIPIEERPIEEIAVSADGATVVVVYGVMPPTDDPMLADRPDRNQLALETWSVPGQRKAEGLRATADVTALGVAPDGRRAYLGLRDGHVATVDTTSFAEVARRGPQPSEITAIDIEPKSGRLAATDVDLSTTIYPP